MRLRMVVIVMILAIVTTALPALATEGSTSHEGVSWWWDDGAEAGVSELIRTDDGVSARWRSTHLTPGDAVTLWLIVFNNPAACSTSPCSVPGDLFNAAADGDFYWAAGAVVGANGIATVAGSLAVGDTSHSGKTETGLGTAVPLTNPHGAEVMLAAHSHGPASGDRTLRTAQLSSYLGGCEVFNGDDGFATGPGDLPDNPGECATIQKAVHFGD